MKRLLKSVWFPLLLGTGLCATSLGIAPNSFGATFLFALGLLVLTDCEFWWGGAMTATHFYEGQEPQVDWWKITRDAYKPSHFYRRMLWLLPISLLFSTAFQMNDALLWIMSGSVFCANATFLFIQFRGHIKDYMDGMGVPLKDFTSAGEARFATRNLEERQ